MKQITAITCTCATLRMYANRKGWDLADVRVAVNFERDSKNNISSFTRTIKVSGQLNKERKLRLLAIVNGCFIHQTLTNAIDIKTELN